MKQRAFTLVELVVVIVILGVLAVIALPKYLSFSDDADIAAVEGYAGAFESAISLVHKSRVLEARSSGAMNDLSKYDGLDTNELGYPIGKDKAPVADRTQPGSIGKGNKACAAIWDQIMVQKGAVLESGGALTNETLFVSKRVGTTNPYYECIYYYVKSGFNDIQNIGSLGFIYNSRTGKVNAFNHSNP